MYHIVSVLFRRYLTTIGKVNNMLMNILVGSDICSYMFFTVSVGAGSAGSVLASRLSENSHVTVLLIEAGGDDRNQPVLDTPLLLAEAQGTKFDWQYKVEKQKHSTFGLVEKVSFVLPLSPT